MNFTLVLLSGPDTGPAHRRALAFGAALAASGHRLLRVFFYGQSVRIALPWEGDEKLSWQTLADAHGAELVLCSASAERYEIASAPDGFVIAGLGSLMEAGQDCDRVVSFA